MIVVDTSVWVGHFREELTPAVAKLRSIEFLHEIVVGDLVLLECLQGARDETHAARIESTLTAFQIRPILDTMIAIEAARHYRALRTLGITARKTTDLIIAAFCIAHGFRLLHQDRDFDPFVVHRGLQIL